MVNFLFENNSEEEKCIEIIKCPNPNDCKNETGDGRYDTFNVQADSSHKVETKCDEICWKYCGGEYYRTSSTIIQI
ncbi:MAG: hypothetical protein COA97_00210 [Flavobacteriales bacterium]|nr:MAG: hypothetical protein COA97_00210 [Flavobacteriales bacterium]